MYCDRGGVGPGGGGRKSSCLPKFLNRWPQSYFLGFMDTLKKQKESNQIRNPTVKTIQKRTRSLLSFLAPMISKMLASAYLNKCILEACFLISILEYNWLFYCRFNWFGHTDLDSNNKFRTNFLIKSRFIGI